MAGQDNDSDKTEDPSQKRLDDALKRGDVVKSQEVTMWFMTLGTLALLALLAPSTSASLMLSLKTILANADQYDVGGAGFGPFLWNLAFAVIVTALVPVAVMSACALVGNLVQHRFVWSGESLQPKLSKISPLSGFKRLFSPEALVNFVKGLVKLVLVSTVMVFVVWPDRHRLETLITAEPLVMLAQFQELSIKLVGATLIVVTLIAAADYLYQRHRWWERQKMTLQEVKEEYKQSEGDPKVKGRIRQIRQERAKKRMMSEVPKATVVITNPTHFAVALKYDRSMAAPICLAKGADAVALKIREVAKEHGVPVIENPPLARALFASVELDDSIPVEHFQAVAQVIGYVMRLNEKARWRA